MDINKIGAFVAHMIACGVFLYASYLADNNILQIAIFVEIVAIYFNTKK